MLEIVHCVSDEKFINGVIEVFDYTQGENKNHYVYFPEGKQVSKYKYLKYSNKVSVVNRDTALSYIHCIPCDVLILHNLSSFPIEHLRYVKSSIKVVWFAWGYDLYSRFKGHRSFIPIELHLPLTKKVIQSAMLEQLKQYAKRTRWYILGYKNKVEESVKRVDYFSGVIPWEYDMMKKNSFFKAEKVEFTYFDMNPIATEATKTIFKERGQDIIIGNSAGSTNNHIDIMKQLSYVGIKDRRVIIPLSYAGNKRYIKKVINYGSSLWGEKMISLNTFIPLSDYQKIMRSCGYAVYGVNRQQALGNILMALWDGLVVFMSKTSPLYHHLVHLGFKLFTTQDDLHLIAEGYRLNSKEIIDNREVLLQYYSQDICFNKIASLYKILAKNG